MTAEELFEHPPDTTNRSCQENATGDKMTLLKPMASEECHVPTEHQEARWTQQTCHNQPPYDDIVPDSASSLGGSPKASCINIGSRCPGQAQKRPFKVRRMLTSGKNFFLPVIFARIVPSFVSNAPSTCKHNVQTCNSFTQLPRSFCNML